MAGRPPTATVWVGNIPFDTTEGEVHGLLSQIGQIKNFRLIMDRETGKPKGFGFCEFHSKDDAESAFRNLNGTMFKNRQIRIDYAEENMSDRGYGKPRGDRDGGGRPDRGDMDGRGPPPPRSHHPPIGLAAAQQSAAQVASLLGGTPSSDRRTQEMLNDLLASKSRPELWEAMRLFKEMHGGDRNAAKAWFAERPALTKAVFQAQVLLGMVKPLAPGFAPPPPGFPAVGGPMGLAALPPGAVAAPPPGQQMAQVVIVDPVTGQPQTVMVPADQLGALGTVQAAPAAAPPGIVQGQPDQGGGIILQQQQPMQAMPMAVPQQQQPQPQQQILQQQPVQQQQQLQQVVQQQQQPAAAGGILAGQDPQQMQVLLRQVMGMSDEQINALPEAYRQQVLYVKEQVRSGHVRLE